MSTGYVMNADGSYTFMLPGGKQIIATGVEAQKKAAELDARGQSRGLASFEPQSENMSIQPPVEFGPPPPPPNQSTNPTLTLRMIPNLFIQPPIITKSGERIDQTRLNRPPADDFKLDPNKKSHTLFDLKPAQEEKLDPSMFAGNGAAGGAEPGRRVLPNYNVPQQARVFVQPGGEQLAARTTQHGPGLTPEDEEQLAEFSIDQRLATQELADAERAALAGQNRVSALTHQNYLKRERDLREAEAARTAREEAALAESKAADDALGDYTIKPDRFWSSRNGWQKGVALLGGVLGGTFAARSASGRNHFAEKLDEMVEEDIYAQKEELASLERKARAKKDYVTATQLANDRARLSENEMWEQRLKTLSAYAQRVEMETQDPIIAARAKLVDLDIQQKLAERFIAEEQTQRGTETRQYVNVPDRAVVIGGSQAGTDYEPEGKDLEKSVNDYVKQSESIAEARAAASSLTKALELEQEDASGLGYVAGELPGFTVGIRGRANRQLVEDFIATTARAMFGANMTEQEFERHRKRVIGNGSEEHLRRSVAEVNKQVQERERHIQSGYHPRVIELAKRRGATAARPIHPSAREGASQ